MDHFPTQHGSSPISAWIFSHHGGTHSTAIRDSSLNFQKTSNNSNLENQSDKQLVSLLTRLNQSNETEKEKKKKKQVNMKSIQYFHSSNDIMFSLIINLVTTIRRFIDVAIHIQVTVMSDLLCQGNNPLSQLPLLPQENIQAQANSGLRIILLINQLSLQLVKLTL
ncbi:hypothetical protein L873DRAFT_271029 [Choiromyces venosus 120613-1]|uniref:Uncharacterized protein n=1 Tax=Choiromyces venosus 120613-1 TaxID=1336337 RepID=A0A3N4J550_9PEZI|nr:hypothetical protein L873DRAFT_271029 [Choiromyces venosus 120613-1]